MAEHLVADVRLGGVERLARVADVLRGVEHAERQPGQEVTRRQQTGHRAQCEARAGWRTDTAICQGPQALCVGPRGC